MKLLSEYIGEKNRCAKVFKSGPHEYTVNFWDPNLEIDDWIKYNSEDSAENSAETWVL